MAQATRDLLTTGAEKHRAGDLAAARRLYESVLAQSPDDADALHLLGLVEHQEGRSARGRVLIERAIALRPAEIGRAHV